MRKLIAALLAGSLIFAPAVQAKKAAKPSAAALVKTAEQQLMTAQSYSALSTSTRTEAMKDRQANTVKQAMVECVEEPFTLLQSFTDVSDVTGELRERGSQELICYEDGEAVTYFYLDGEPMRVTLPDFAKQMREYRAKYQNQSPTNTCSNFVYAGKTKLRGRSVHVVTATPNAESVQFRWISLEFSSSMKEHWGKIPIKMYIDVETNNFLRIEADYTDAWNAYFPVPEGAAYSHGKQTVTLDIAGIGSTDVQAPRELTGGATRMGYEEYRRMLAALYGFGGSRYNGGKIVQSTILP